MTVVLNITHGETDMLLFINFFLAVHLKNGDVYTVPIIDVSFDHLNENITFLAGCYI